MNSHHQARLLAALVRIEAGSSELASGLEDYREAFRAIIAEGEISDLERLGHRIGPPMLNTELRSELAARGLTALIAYRQVVREADHHALARFRLQIENQAVNDPEYSGSGVIHEKEVDSAKDRLGNFLSKIGFQRDA